MTTLRLSGPEMGELRDLLREALSRTRLDEFLRYRLNRRVDDYTGNDDYPTGLRKASRKPTPSSGGGTSLPPPWS